jgi:transposase InsO family protein
MDLFVVPTIGFKLLYGLAILRLGRRQLVWTNATTNLTAEWIARQITEAFPWDQAPGYLVRDRDGAYGTILIRRLQAMGIRDRPTAARSPWQNGHTERLIGSMRRECLDHVVIFAEAHLRRTLRAYADYYNRARTHLALAKDTPLGRPAPSLPKTSFRLVRVERSLIRSTNSLIRVLNSLFGSKHSLFRYAGNSAKNLNDCR